MSLEDNTTCALCLVDFVDEEEVRPVHPTQGLVFPTSHIFPDGQDRLGRRLPEACRDNHDEPHIHEKCIPAWEDKFNLTTPETREEAAETAGIPRFSVFGLSDTEYTAEEVADIFDSTLDEDAFSEIFEEEEEPELDVVPLTDMDDYVDEALEVMASEMEEEDQEEDCPIGCPHKLYLHKEITDQVLLCSLCDCSF
jgi:hypothetical protein